VAQRFSAAISVFFSGALAPEVPELSFSANCWREECVVIISLPFEQEQRVDELVAHPWPHLVIDNFLPGAVLAQALSEISADTYNFDIEQRGTGRIEYSLLKSETM
jgi:hypothetical protein